MNRILVGGLWREADAVEEFSAYDPTSGKALDDTYPVSSRSDVEDVLQAAVSAVDELFEVPHNSRAAFLSAYAREIEARRESLVHIAHAETALPIDPRLNGELTRTVDQLRQAAAAVEDGSWVRATIDSQSNIRSMLAPLHKPVVAFGPNNFPFAFNAISGGDFASAVAAGNPVIAKGHPGHPGTTRLLGEAVLAAITNTGVPSALVQMLYHIETDVGLELVSDRRVGAVAFTGSQRGGLALKAAAESAGVPIYLEMGSINPVFVLDGALAARGNEIAEEFFASCNLGAGQYCTSPGMVVVPDGAEGDAFVQQIVSLFERAGDETLLSPPGPVAEGVRSLKAAGAELLVGGTADGKGFSFANTLLTVSAKDYLARPQALQREVFGPVSLLVRAAGLNDTAEVAETIEGSLTGSIYADPSDDEAHERVARLLRPSVGRLLVNKMPTGVAVVPSMNHGGPYPATAHPGFTSVGIPTSMVRFAALHCYDNVPDRYLPPPLRDENPNGTMWRNIDGNWSRADVA